ncbi:hypothetical protein BC831DRAFT_45815 [Entophlyctis helioformis]|nr:hypothetical protein BC831DRAFT_45815 [Entophlyctis helioformis]
MRCQWMATGVAWRGVALAVACGHLPVPCIIGCRHSGSWSVAWTSRPWLHLFGCALTAPGQSRRSDHSRCPWMLASWRPACVLERWRQCLQQTPPWTQAPAAWQWVCCTGRLLSVKKREGPRRRLANAWPPWLLAG